MSTFIDTFGRVHSALRISVTDRCNLRCVYCMPLDAQFMARSEILSFEEIARVVRVLADQGISRVRITGGEPLARAQLWRLVEMISAMAAVRDLALTTNGVLLADQAQRLRDAGLERINISLDTLDPATFERLARRPGLERVLAGIQAALSAGFQRVRLNTVALAGISEHEIVRLAEFARNCGAELRFIEFMPLDGQGQWHAASVLTGARIRDILQQAFGPLAPAPRPDPSQPAVDFRYTDGGGRVGFINPVSEPFCGSCNRLRLSADGNFRNCLFSNDDWNVRPVLRGGGSDQQIVRLVRECIMHKRAGHGLGTDDALIPAGAMYQIGG